MLRNKIRVAENNHQLREYFEGQREGYVRVGPENWLLPAKYNEKSAEKYRNFKVRSDDIWITGFPRSGTTVTQEIVWLLAHDLNYEAAEEDLDERVRYFELDLVFDDKKMKERMEKFPNNIAELKRIEECMKNNLRYLDEDEERRVIKTHLPFELLPSEIFTEKCKVIYVSRDPRDVAVSYYFYEKGAWHLNFTGDFNTHWNLFKSGNCMFSPYFSHINQGLSKRKMKNFLFISYEDLIKHPEIFILKLSKFLGKSLSYEQLRRLKNHVEFENFKKNSAVSKNLRDEDDNEIEFVRKGKIGEWKHHFDDKMELEAYHWLDENNYEKIECN